MKRIYKGLILIFILCLLVTLTVATDKNGKKETLDGCAMLILGDSYSAHHQLAAEAGWPSIVAERCGMTLYDYAISGSTLAAGDGGREPMVQRYKTVEQADYDIIILQGGSNDWSREIPIGTADSRDETTMLGAMNVMLDYFEDTWPDATIICFTPWVSTGATNDLGLETTAYTEAMQQLCESRGILCYDASDTAQNGIRMNQETFRAQYCLSATDRWHLNAAGQQLFAEAFIRWLQENLMGVTTADRFCDMTTASQPLKLAVSRVYENGILFGTSESLFSPSQAATRTTLAVTLYRIAGQVETTGRSFSDVATDDGAYSAICWVVNQGIMEADGAFEPEQTLTRGELVSAVYAYYEQAGGEPLQFRSLGQYSDMEQVPEDQRIPWGWLLKQTLIEPIGDRLVPEGIVSRGQLAVTLSRLMGEL